MVYQKRNEFDEFAMYANIFCLNQGDVTEVAKEGLATVFTVRLPVPDKDILVPAARFKAPCCPPKEVTALLAIFAWVMTFEPA